MVGVGPSTQPTSAAYQGQLHQDPMIGRWVLDQYVVQAKIGEGGMGAVYLAEQPSVGRNAVIKIMHPWLSRDPKIAARFDTEARAAAQGGARSADARNRPCRSRRGLWTRRRRASDHPRRLELHRHTRRHERRPAGDLRALR